MRNSQKDANNEIFEVDSFLPRNKQFLREVTVFLIYVQKIGNEREKIKKLVVEKLEKERLENKSPCAHSSFVNEDDRSKDRIKINRNATNRK